MPNDSWSGTLVLDTPNHCTVDAGNIHESIKRVSLMAITPVILFANIVLLCLLIAHRSLHRPGYLLIVSLCCADILVGGTCIGTIVTAAREATLSECLVRVGLSVTAVQASILSLLCVACDRWLAIARALRYTHLVTTRRTLFVILLNWAYSLLLGMAPLLGWNDGPENYLQYCSFLYVFSPSYIGLVFLSDIVPIAAILIIHVYLYVHARMHISRIDAMELVFVGQKDTAFLGMSTRAWRCLRTVTCVAGCLLACWCPFLACALYAELAPNPPCVVRDIVGTHLLVLGFFNSALNPVVYTLCNRELRITFATTIKRKCCRNSLSGT